MPDFVIRSLIRPISGGDGPFWVQTSVDKSDGLGFTDGNITLTLSFANAFAQASADIIVASATLSAATAGQVTISSVGRFAP